MKKYQHYIDVWGELLPKIVSEYDKEILQSPGTTSRQLVRPLNNLERKNGFFRNRENLLRKNTAGSVILHLLMGTNEKCNNSHAPYHRLMLYSVLPQNSIFLKDQNTKKYEHYIDVRGEILLTQRGTATAGVTSK